MIYYWLCASVDAEIGVHPFSKKKEEEEGSVVEEQQPFLVNLKLFCV